MIRFCGVIKQTVDDDWKKLDVNMPFANVDYDIINSSLEIANIKYYIYIVDLVKGE